LAQSNTLVVANLDVDSTESALRQLLWLLEHPDRELAQDQVASALRVCTCQRLLRSADRSSMLTCHEILDVSPEMRTAIRNFDLERIGRTLASHSISSSMKRAAKMLLDKGLIHADQYEKV
jgi:Tfp pilus assembly pilus retraction ATPase PilT